jgi:hypothetical protein
MSPQPPRSPQLVRAIQRCYELGTQHRQATDPVTKADLRTSMADATDALAAAKQDGAR